MKRREGALAYTFQTSFGTVTYSTEAAGDPVTVSEVLIDKYGHYFAQCGV
jgi:hypothetical protein